MATQQVDAITSFAYLTENVPNWIVQFTDLLSYASQKNEEFVAEYARIIKTIKPKQIKSPSLHSIHSEQDTSADILPVDPTSVADQVEIDPLVAGNRYLYAQAQRKRKPERSVRSGASGPPKFRTKHQVVVYYDSHLQETLDSMVKAIGIARNNLRKGKNALVTLQGFQLPALSRRSGPGGSTPGLEALRNTAVSRSSPMLLGNKYRMTSSQRQPANEDEAAFVNADKGLESMQGLCETAAHQFLRDGDCKAELELVITQLNKTLQEAGPVLEHLKEVARQREELATLATVSDTSAAPSISETATSDSDATLFTKPSIEPLNMVDSKLAPTLEALGDMKARNVVSAPAVPTMANLSSLPTASVEIEVDDDSDQSEIDVDISKFRFGNMARLRAL